MNLGDYRDKAEQLSQPENFKEAVKENWQMPSIGLLFAISLWIRYLPEKGMDHLQALDPYMIYRMSQHLALSGSLPALDFTRYFPYATPIYTMNLGDFAIPALMYRYMGFSLIFPEYMEFAQFYPALMGAIGVVAMYFLGKELFDKFTGVSAAFFLATLGGVMHRTSAGFFEKEPTGTAFMLISMVFFTRAWKRKDWKNGIISGLTFGIFTISWGGSKMLWLLYPMIVAGVLFFDEDIRSMIAAYTPTVLVAGFFAAAFNSSRFWITQKFFLANIALVALLWSRYLIEEYELLEKNWIKYYIPSTYFAGGFLAITAPLYSETLGNLVFGIWRQATQQGSGVIGGTVAENQAASLSSLVQSLGVNSAGALSALNNWFIQTFGFAEPVVQALSIVLNPIANLIVFISTFANVWTFMLFGIPILGTHILIMIARKYDIIDEISGKTYYSYMLAVSVSWIIAATGFFASTELARAILENPGRQQVMQYAAQLRVNSLIAGVISAAGLSTLVYYLKEDAYKLLLIVFGFLTIGEVIAALNVTGSQNLRVIIFALLRAPFAQALFLPVLGGFIAALVLYLVDDFRMPELKDNWYLVIPLFWFMTNILMAASRSRLVFLAGFPATLAAGYAFTKAFRKLRDMKLPDFDLENPEYAEDGRKALLAILGAIIIITSIFSGVAVAQQLGGSPSQAWDPALNYMENETPEGSVVLSWWDYGYWFESIGRRAAVADGGNFGYYSGSDPKINYPLADFLAGSNASEHRDFLKKHSVDYIALDRSMIGKYSAVSQISRRSNTNFTSMNTLTTQRPINTYLQQPEGERVARFSGGSLSAFAPMQVDGQTSNNSISNLSVEFDGPVTLRSGSQTLKVDCALTDEGQKNLGNTSERRTIPYCVAERPAPDFELAARTQNSAGMVLVPKEITDSTLVRLYLMDGYGIDFVEKKDVSRFEYVKMWEVKDLE